MATTGQSTTQSNLALILMQLQGLTGDVRDIQEKIDCLTTEVATTRLIVSNLEKQVIGNGRAGLMDRVLVLEQDVKSTKEKMQKESVEQDEYRKLRLQESIDKRNDVRDFQFSRTLQWISIIGAVLVSATSAILAYVLKTGP